MTYLLEPILIIAGGMALVAFTWRHIRGRRDDSRGSTDEAGLEAALERYRTAQAKAVMPLIGPLLDAWE